MTRTQLVGPALRLVRAHGGEPAAFIKRFKLPETAEHDPDVTLPLKVLHAFLDAVAVETKQPLLGLELPAFMEMGTYGLLAYLWRTSATVGDALQIVARYMPLLNEVVVVTITNDGSNVELVHEVPGEANCLGHHGNECWLGMTLLALTKLGSEPVIASHASLAHRDPGTREGFAKAVGMPARSIEYGRNANGFVIPTRALAIRVPTADNVLHDVLRTRADDDLLRQSGRSRFLGLVRESVREQLATTLPTVAGTAKRLRITTRTLQRRLQEEGTSFHDLLESVRCELACSLLRGSAGKVSDIAAELQYADESSFVRAFKRWMGTTPGAYRRRGQPR